MRAQPIPARINYAGASREQVAAERGGELLQARTRDFRTVLVRGDESMIGKYFTVELTGTTGSTFTGAIERERTTLPLAV